MSEVQAVAFRGHYLQFNIKGKILGFNWENTFTKAIDTDTLGLLEGQIAFTAPLLKTTVDAIWDTNGFVLGLQGRYANLLPAASNSSVDYLKVIARSSTMLSPVQYERTNSMAGTSGIPLAQRDVSWTACYNYAACDDYGQTGARFWSPANDEGFKEGNTFTDTFLAMMTSPAYGILNSINSTTHVFHYLLDGLPSSTTEMNNIVVRREKIEVLPPMPPYKGKYKYEFPYYGAINAFTCSDFVSDGTVSHMDSRAD